MMTFYNRGRRAVKDAPRRLWTPLVEFAPGNSVGDGEDQPAVYSSASDLDAGLGVNRTPLTWPVLGAVYAVTLGLSSTTPGFSANGQIQIAVAEPATLVSLPGAASDASATFTGDGYVTQYLSSPVDAFYLDKFGGWLTDYLTVDAGTDTNNRTTRADTGYPAAILDPDPTVGQAFQASGTIDVRMRCRRSDWASSTNLATVFNLNGNFGLGFYLPSGGTTYQATIRMERSDLWPTLSQSNRVMTGPLSDLGLVNGEWTWIRMTYDPSNGVRIWTSTSGTSWTLRATFPLTSAPFDPNDRPVSGAFGGTFKLGSSDRSPGRGLDGDFSDAEFYVNDTLRQTLDLSAMTSSTALTWTPAVGGEWDRETQTPNGYYPVVTGATKPPTIRVHCDLDAPCPVQRFRLIVDAIVGVATVDSITLHMRDDWI